MNSVFDWLREQIRDNKYEVYNGYSAPYDVIDLKDTENIINEAEAKWEEECCEWKKSTVFINYLVAHDGEIALMMDAKKWKHCPYCGKKIKVVE